MYVHIQYYVQVHASRRVAMRIDHAIDLGLSCANAVGNLVCRRQRLRKRRG